MVRFSRYTKESLESILREEAFTEERIASFFETSPFGIRTGTKQYGGGSPIFCDCIIRINLMGIPIICDGIVSTITGAIFATNGPFAGEYVNILEPSSIYHLQQWRWDDASMGGCSSWQIDFEVEGMYY